MTQSRRMSLLEATINVIVGFWVAVATQVLIFPLFGINVSFASNVVMAVPFTVISIIRGYALRRFFNWLNDRSNYGRHE
jgi:hypothetical protein